MKKKSNPQPSFLHYFLKDNDDDEITTTQKANNTHFYK